MKNKNEKLDNTYKDTWNTRLKKLNYSTYQDYLNSSHWKEVKAKAKTRENYQKCEFCSDTKIQLHHTTYKWINTKHELRAIIALCKAHHEQVHVLAKNNRLSVRIATNILRKIYKPNYRHKNIGHNKNKNQCNDFLDTDLFFNLQLYKGGTTTPLVITGALNLAL